MPFHKNKILLIDNEDSFTYNLYQLFEEAGASIKIELLKNIDFETALDFDGIIISPGPGLPSEVHNLISFIQFISTRKPILGVCLGMQAIAESFGGKLFNTKNVQHGRKLEINVIKFSKIFEYMPTHFNVGLYHSWAVEYSTLPSELNVTAISPEEVIMALEHKHLPVYGVQFHPESIISENGKFLAKNFLKIINS